jgi:hypothetical protein
MLSILPPRHFNFIVIGDENVVKIFYPLSDCSAYKWKLDDFPNN